jgi:hypothetical protein
MKMTRRCSRVIFSGAPGWTTLRYSVAPVLEAGASARFTPYEPTTYEFALQIQVAGSIHDHIK